MIFPSRLSGFSGGHVFESSFYAGEGFQFIDAISEFLIGGGILHDDGGLSIDGEDERVAAAAHLFYKVAGVALEIAQGMNVGADIQHFASTSNVH